MPFPLDHYIEASHVDYKERLEEKKPRSWLKSVSAFANTEGGHLIFGVKNEPREVVGLENPQAVVSRLTELIKVRIDPTPRYRVREVEIEGKSCVDLEVKITGLPKSANAYASAALSDTDFFSVLSLDQNR